MEALRAVVITGSVELLRRNDRPTDFTVPIKALDTSTLGGDTLCSRHLIIIELRQENP
jgi:hypothetical protein